MMSRMKQESSYTTADGLAGVLRLLEQIDNELDRYSATHRPLFGGEIYLTDKELSERLKISRRTLQEYRSSGTIGYYLICGKILYKESEIERMLCENYRERDENALPAK